VEAYVHAPRLLDSPPKVKDFLSNKQQLNRKQQQFNKSTKKQTIAESLLQFDCCCLCFLFDFKFKARDLTRPGQGPANFNDFSFMIPRH
jgi:hypothetical protein